MNIFMFMKVTLKLRPLFLICLAATLPAHAQESDILIKNGKILDGTGNSWYYADIAVQHGKIVAMGKLNHLP